jgi:hypothetical protein
MFMYQLEDGTHKPLTRGKRPIGAKKVYFDHEAGEIAPRQWVKMEKTVKKTVLVHPDKVTEFDHSPKGE